ncbi:MAG: hypothetical protein RLZZ04_1288 [Cyanobacteriota bacterium]|jgi:hypothetical protein
MSEIPTLDQFGIEPPVFVRKIDNKNRWIEHDLGSISDRARKIAINVFNAEICSLWWIKSDEDFHGFVASISSNRSPQNQNIDFIWMTKKDLELAKIECKNIPEGDCLAVKNLHYNATIDEKKAILLCSELIKRQQEPQRCRKKQTELILQQQRAKRCVAVTKTPPCQHHLCI